MNDVEKHKREFNHSLIGKNQEEIRKLSDLLGNGKHSFEELYCSDCHTVSISGVYYFDTNTANKPSDFSNGVALVQRATTGNGIDTYIILKSGSLIAQCYYSSRAKAWQPWEYVNPQMEANVEYRTTERYMGKPVFKKLITYSTSASLGSTTLNVQHNTYGIDQLVRINARAGARPFPVIFSATEITSIYAIDASTITIRAIGSDFGAETLYFEMAYTKK